MLEIEPRSDADVNTTLNQGMLLSLVAKPVAIANDRQPGINKFETSGERTTILPRRTAAALIQMVPVQARLGR